MNVTMRNMMTVRLSIAMPRGTTRLGTGVPSARRHGPTAQNDPVEPRGPDERLVVAFDRAGTAVCFPCRVLRAVFCGRFVMGIKAAFPGVIHEADDRKQARKRDGPGCDISVQPLQLPDEDRLDRERGQWDQHGGRVEAHLPDHFVVRWCLQGFTR